MSNLQIEMTVAAIVLLFLIIFNLKRSSLSVKNSVLWLLLPVVLIIIAIFPDPFTDFANFLGFETLANFIFVVFIALLIILIFSLSITLSREQTKIIKLTQEVSLLKQQKSSKSAKSTSESSHKSSK